MFSTPFTLKEILQEYFSQINMLLAHKEMNLYRYIGGAGKVSNESNVKGMVNIHMPTRNNIDLNIILFTFNNKFGNLHKVVKN